MAAKTTGNNQSANNILKLILHGTTWANIAENAMSGALTQFYLSLHTANPGPTGNQGTTEITYSGYARVALPRSAAGTTIVNNAATLASNKDFPVAPAGASGNITHWALGTDLSGAGNVIYSGPVSPTIVLAEGVQPRLTTGTTITEL